MLPSKSSIYHSALVKACKAAGGCLEVTLQSRSEDPKPGEDLASIRFLLAGEDQERRYLIENARIRAALDAAPLNAPVQIRAGGKRGHATLAVFDHAGELIANSTTVELPDAPADGSPAPGALPAGESLAAVLWEALKTGAEMERRYRKKYGRTPSAFVTAVGVSLAEQHLRSGGALPIRRHVDQDNREKEVDRG